jgi:hypothetical protein
MLKSGGSLLYANFAKNIPDNGYMETFMNWHLICRDEKEMEELWSGISTSGADRYVFFGENRNIIYAMLTKRR